ncbi:MAG: flippase [Parcubacteria group bacterium]|nr:flippase [Parcubacteria group bacterium]
MRLERISFNVLFAIFSRVITGGIGLFVIAVMSRSLGQAGYGNYSTILSYMLIFSVVGDLGLYTLLVREISRNDKEESYIASNFFTLRLITIAVTAILAILISEFLTPYPRLVKDGLIVGTIFLVFSSLTQVLSGIYQKYLRFYLISFADILSSLVQLAIILFVASKGRDLLPYVWAASIASLVQFSIVFINVQKLVPISLHISFSFWRKILKDSLPVAVSLVFTVIYFRIDTIMLSLIKTPNEVGIYSIAAKVLEVIIFLPALYMGLVMPVLSKEAVSNVTNFRRIFKKTFDILAAFSVPTVVFLAILSAKIVVIVGGSTFLASYQPLFILAFAVGLIFFGNLVGRAAVALDLQKRSMWIYLGGAILNIILNLLLIPSFSFNGAAFATLMTELFITLALFRLVSVNSGAKIDYFRFFKFLFLGLAMALVIYPLRNQFILIPVFVGSLVYFGGVYAFKIFSREDLISLIKEGRLSEKEASIFEKDLPV